MSANGPRDLAVLASTLRAFAYKDLKLQMLRGLRNGGKPFIEEAKRNAAARLPKSGGLNQLVTDEKIAVRNRLSANGVAVSIRTNWRLLNQTNAGYVRHPVFARSYSDATGHRASSGSDGSHRSKTGEKWVTQQLPNGARWWDDAVVQTGPRAEAEMYAVMRETADLILARVRGL